ncbi:MAG: hypothetical protein ACKPKO_12690, partial [Candidatus Fonsibacter sp.]
MSEWWINTLYDNYEQTLLRSDNQKNLITRETILEDLGRGEYTRGSDHQQSPAFLRKVQAEATRLRRLLQPHSQIRPRGAELQPPPLLLRHRRGHIYTLNKDLDNLAQKSEDDDYKISVGSNFHIPDKPNERSNHITIEHIDEMLD